MEYNSNKENEENKNSNIANGIYNVEQETNRNKIKFMKGLRK